MRTITPPRFAGCLLVGGTLVLLGGCSGDKLARTFGLTRDALDVPQNNMSPGQSALVQEAGPAAPSDIRRKVDQDARLANDNDSFVDKVLYWRKPDTQHVQIDAQKESQRLRENAALGEAPDVGQTPIIQQKKSGWFSNLFSWL